MEFAQILAEFEVEVIDADAAPRRPMQTRAVATLRRAFERHGEGFLRSLLRVFGETNPGSRWALSVHVVMAVEDILAVVPDHDGRLFDAFDAVDLSKIDQAAARLAGVVPKKATAATMLAIELQDLLSDRNVLRGRGGWMEQMDAIADRLRRWVRANRAEEESEAAAVLAGAAALGMATADAQMAWGLSRLSAEARLTATARSLCRRTSAAILLAAAALPTAEEQVAALEAYAIPRRKPGSGRRKAGPAPERLAQAA